MPRKVPAPGTPEDWLVFAKSSLSLARQPKPEEALWEDHCFLAHQAVEKALKAVYQHRGQMFEFIHDLKKLGKGLEQGGLRIPPEIREAFRLTKYVLESRYPGTIERV
ncbi:MAG TPA: HEPN domain-containing protein, partial [bacterium]|nr:HEPN domain-containing protein [bacterium]